MSTMIYRNDIQILRGIAVLVVVLFHISPNLSAGGFLGVDIFFVISGFLMRALYYSGETKHFALDFYKRRFRRIFPAYFVTIMASLVTGAFVFVPYEFDQLSQMSLASLFFSPNLYFWTGEGYFDEFSFRPLLHLWSLGVEVQFYILVPLFIFLLNKSRSIVFFITLGSFIACLVVLSISTKTAFFILVFRLWEFLIGFTCAHIFGANGNLISKDHKAKILPSCALIGIVGISFLDVSNSNHPGWTALIVALFVATILAVGLPIKITSSYPGRTLATLGKYSYSLYLVHFPVLYFSYHQALSGDTINVKLDPKFFITITFMGVLTYLLFHVVEKSNWKEFQKKFIFIIPALSFILIFAISRYVNAERHNSYQTNISNAPNDRSYWRCGKTLKLLSVFNKSMSYCIINSDISNTNNNILLIGDSHADAIKTSLGTVASKNGARLYFYMESCSIGKEGCDIETLTNLVKRLNIKAVVAHDLYRNLSPSNLKDFSEKMDKLAISTYYVDPVPVYPYSVPLYLLDSKSGKNSNDSFVKTKSDFEKLYSKTYDAIATTKFVRVPTLNYLCTPNCMLSNKDRSYYSDSHHLSLTGAKLLEPMFQNYIFSTRENKKL